MKKLFSRNTLTSATAIIICFMLVNFVFHMVTGWQYGLFMDEAYYYSMSNHLDFGYVDVAPVTAWLMALSRMLLGDSIHAIHVFPALAGSLTMFFAALTARKMGGGKFAQCVTALAVMMAPMFMAISSMFTYDVFDQLMSAIVIYMSARILAGEDSPRTWVLFGFMAGIGLMIKITTGFMILALVIGLLLTRQRKHLKNKWFWIAAAIAVACFVPYVIWQAVRGFPIAEYLQGYRIHRTLMPSPAQLLLNTAVAMNPLSVVLWVCGLVFLFKKRGRTFRPFGWAFAAYFALASVMYIKFYALAGVLLPLVAYGAVCMENNFCNAPREALPANSAKKSRITMALKAAYVGLVCLFGIALVPINVPLLAPRDTIAYNNLLGISRLIQFDNAANGFLHAGRLGWEEMTKTVADAYYSLPEDERRECKIFCLHYFEAGSIDYYAEEYGIPEPISGHLGFYYWGNDGYNGGPIIMVGMQHTLTSQMMQLFDQVKVVDGPHTNFALYFVNDVPIYICDGLKMPVDEFWKLMRRVD